MPIRLSENETLIDKANHESERQQLKPIGFLLDVKRL